MGWCSSVRVRKKTERSADFEPWIDLFARCRKQAYPLSRDKLRMTAAFAFRFLYSMKRRKKMLPKSWPVVRQPRINDQSVNSYSKR